MVAGLASAGVDVVRLGVLPTPGVAFLTGRRGADLGVMLSASHNPMPDNGIKFFARGGLKLDDDLEDAIEARMGAVGAARRCRRRPGVRRADCVERYVRTSSQSRPPVQPHGAQGRRGLRERGRRRWPAPRRCSRPRAPRSSDPRPARRAQHQRRLRVDAHGRPAGCGARPRRRRRIALDGDADRCLAVDASGHVVDGDQILAILALASREAAG